MAGLAREMNLSETVFVFPPSDPAAAVRVGGRRWDIHFNNGVIAKLPEENLVAAWTRLADLDAQYRVLDRALLSIDLRLADRLVLGLEPPPPPPPKAPARGNTKGRGA